MYIYIYIYIYTYTYIYSACILVYLLRRLSCILNTHSCMWCRFGRAVILLCYLSHMAQMDLRSRCRLTAIQSRVVVLRHGDASCLYCHQSCGGSVHVSSGVAAVGARANHHPPARTQSAGGAHQGCHKQDLRAGVHWLG